MKKLGLLLTIIGLVIAMVGCGKSASGSGEDGSVAVVLKTLSSPYWKYVEAGAKAAGKDLGVDVTIVGPASESQIMEQVNMIEDSLNQGIGSLVVSPTQPDTVVPVLEQANVPVLFIDTDADFSGKTSFIGTDNLTAGKEGGKLLASFLKKEMKLLCLVER